jgi:hypothetical protein
MKITSTSFAVKPVVPLSSMLTWGHSLQRSVGAVERSSQQKGNCFALLLIATAFVLSCTLQAKAQFTVLCGNGAETQSSTVPISYPCSGTTPQGASYSGTGKILFNAVNEIAMGSDMTWSGPAPYAQIIMNTDVVGTVVSSTLPSGAPIVLKEYIAGEGTNGTGPYGGPYSYSFSGSLVKLYYDVTLTINGEAVIQNDNQSAFITVYGPSSGSGVVSAGPRTSTYQTTVGSPLHVIFQYNNQIDGSTDGQGTFSYKLDPGLTFAAADPSTGAPVSGVSIVLSDGTVIPVNGGSSYSCSGFQPPFDVALLLKQKTNRAIPLKAQLFDIGHNLVTPTTLGTAAPPVVNVSYNSGVSSAVDESSLLDPLGQSSSGNQFNFDATTGTWWFNLATTPFAASGTYTVTLQPGDSTRYQVSPQCSGTLIRN